MVLTELLLVGLPSGRGYAITSSPLITLVISSRVSYICTFSRNSHHQTIWGLCIDIKLTFIPFILSLIEVKGLRRAILLTGDNRRQPAPISLGFLAIFRVLDMIERCIRAQKLRIFIGLSNMSLSTCSTYVRTST